MKWKEGDAVLLSFPPIYSVLASISEQPESAERPGCAHCPRPQEQPRLGRCGHIAQVRDRQGCEALGVSLSPVCSA